MIATRRNRPQRRGRRASERGITLIELMLSLGIASIVVGMIAGVVFNQQRAFYNELHYAEAQQNARASLALLKRYVRVAGWGMPADPNLLGITGFGACYKDGSSEQQQLNCDGVDKDAEQQQAFWPKGTDRLRVNYIMPQGGGAVTGQPGPVAQGAVVPVGLLANPTPPPGHPLAVNDVAMIAGPCVGGGAAADLLLITSFTGGATAWFDYSYTNVENGGVNFACPGSYDSGYTFGKAIVADFWVDHVTDQDHPTLKLRLNPFEPLSDAYIVAYDIDDLQVRFLIDTTPTPDNIWDEACGNVMISDTTQGGCGDSFTAAQRLARTIGAEVAIVTRTRKRDDRFNGVSMVVQNHQYTANDYRRWIYRATISTRNNDL